MATVVGRSRFQPNRGRWFSETTCKRPRMPRLTSAAELANLAASSARSVPMDPAASIWKPSDYEEHHSSSIGNAPPLSFACSSNCSGASARAIRQRWWQYRQRRKVSVRLTAGAFVRSRNSDNPVAGKRKGRVEAATGVGAILMAPGCIPASAPIVGVAVRASWSFLAV